jgi:hypothetical protein
MNPPLFSEQIEIIEQFRGHFLSVLAIKTPMDFGDDFIID